MHKYQKRIFIAGIGIGLMGILYGCASQVALPDLSKEGEVVAVVREEGSGTREEFENLVGTTEKGADIVATSTEEVMDTVANQNGSIGYLAYSVLDASGVKSIQVDGVTPSGKSIQNGSYPLSRNYYVAYRDTPNAVAQDFLNYLLSAGQEFVGEYCVPMRKQTTFLSDKSKGSIRIQGSTSMEAMMQALIEDYKNYNPNAQIELTATDSTVGITAAIRGECDLAMTSRELKDYESELLTKTAIGKDAIAIVVQENNPVENLSKKQLKELFDMECDTWADLE